MNLCLQFLCVILSCKNPECCQGRVMMETQVQIIASIALLWTQKSRNSSAVPVPIWAWRFTYSTYCGTIQLKSGIFFLRGHLFRHKCYYSQVHPWKYWLRNKAGNSDVVLGMRIETLRSEKIWKGGLKSRCWKETNRTVRKTHSIYVLKNHILKRYHNKGLAVL